MRVLESNFDLGGFHGYLNTLQKPGDSTELHSHPNEHLLMTSGAVRVEAILPDGTLKQVECARDVWWNGWLIKARVKHKVTNIDTGEVRFICLFAHYDENGRYNPDPKIYG